MARLRDEPVLLALAQKVLDYLTRINDAKAMPKVALRLVEHLYFKVRGEVWGKYGGCTQVVEKLATGSGTQQAALQGTSSRGQDWRGIDWLVWCGLQVDRSRNKVVQGTGRQWRMLSCTSA